MSQPQQITISNAALKEAASQGVYEFIIVFIDKYHEATGGIFNMETMSLLNGHQHSLLAYYFFREEVLNGGFVQLIQNGYGSYIFDSPFAEAMGTIGTNEFSKLIYKAKEIYDKHKADLEKDCTEEEFVAMYEQYKSFDNLDNQFMEMEKQLTALIAHYVEEHVEQFAVIV